MESIAVTLVGVVLSNSRSRAVMEIKIDALSRRVPDSGVLTHAKVWPSSSCVSENLR